MLTTNPSITPVPSLMDEDIPLTTFGESQTTHTTSQNHHASYQRPAPPCELLSAIPPHPQGIKPSGQELVANENIKDATGNFSVLPDELFAHIFEILDTSSLMKIGLTCKALWAFSRLDESLWRTRFLNCLAPSQSWRGDWFSTVLEKPTWLPRRMIDCKGLNSDHLYGPFKTLHVRLSTISNGIPVHNQIPRIRELTADEFESTWVHRPFIAEHIIQEWPVTKSWTWETFRANYNNVDFGCEGANWLYKIYQDYMSDNTDESPLYLFDHDFVHKMSLTARKTQSLIGDYWAPSCFGQDYFDVLGDRRPDHRWLIVGPERSGSTFHKDPNGTSAWNAVIRGSKYWIMLPKAPPGVFTSKDHSEVTSPASIAEWLLGYHAEARKSEGCLEGVCREGEILHVPSGWYHLVVNLEPSIAITQNFVPRHYLPDALGFLKYKPDQVSGFKGDLESPYKTFLLRLKEIFPDVVDEALKEMDKKRSPRKRRWEELVQVDSGDGGSTCDSEVERRVRGWNDKRPESKKGEECVKSCFSFCFGGGEGSDAEVP